MDILVQTAGSTGWSTHLNWRYGTTLAGSMTMIHTLRDTCDTLCISGFKDRRRGLRPKRPIVMVLRNIAQRLHRREETIENKCCLLWIFW